MGTSEHGDTWRHQNMGTCGDMGMYGDVRTQGHVGTWGDVWGPGDIWGHMGTWGRRIKVSSAAVKHALISSERLSAAAPL